MWTNEGSRLLHLNFDWLFQSPCFLKGHNGDPQVRVFMIITWYKGEPAWTHALEGPHSQIPYRQEERRHQEPIDYFFPWKKFVKTTQGHQKKIFSQKARQTFFLELRWRYSFFTSNTTIILPTYCISSHTVLLLDI